MLTYLRNMLEERRNSQLLTKPALTKVHHPVVVRPIPIFGMPQLTNPSQLFHYYLEQPKFILQAPVRSHPHLVGQRREPEGKPIFDFGTYSRRIEARLKH